MQKEKLGENKSHGFITQPKVGNNNNNFKLNFDTSSTAQSIGKPFTSNNNANGFIFFFVVYDVLQIKIRKKLLKPHQVQKKRKKTRRK